MVAWLSMALTVALAVIGGIAAMVKMLYGIDKRLAVIEAVVSDDMHQAREMIEQHDRRLRALELAVAAAAVTARPVSPEATPAKRITGQATTPEVPA